MTIHVPRKFQWTLGVGGVLVVLAGLILAVVLVIRRERALRFIPLEQPEVVPVLQRDAIEKNVERALNALSTEPIPLSPIPSPGP